MAERAVKEASLRFQPNYFKLNSAKTQEILFSLRPFDHNVQKPNTVRFLGMVFYSKLQWNAHIDHYLIWILDYLGLEYLVYLLEKPKISSLGLVLFEWHISSFFQSITDTV